MFAWHSRCIASNGDMDTPRSQLKACHLNFVSSSAFCSTLYKKAQISLPKWKISCASCGTCGLEQRRKKNISYHVQMN